MLDRKLGQWITKFNAWLFAGKDSACLTTDEVKELTRLLEECKERKMLWERKAK